MRVRLKKSVKPRLQRWIVSKSPHERELARETLDAMGTENAARYLQQRFVHHNHRVAAYLIPFSLFLLGCATLMLLIVLQVVPLPLWPWIFLMWTNNILIWSYNFRNARWNHALLTTMLERPHPMFLPAFVAALSSVRRQNVALGLQGVEAILPLLQKGDRAVMSAPSWKYLLNLLRTRRLPTPFRQDFIPARTAEALIIGLCGVEYLEALPVVQSIASGNARTTEQAQLRDVAQKYLPRLTNRTETPWYLTQSVPDSHVIRRVGQADH